MVACCSACCFSNCRTLVSNACDAGSLGVFEVAVEAAELGAPFRVAPPAGDVEAAEVLLFLEIPARIPPADVLSIDWRLASVGAAGFPATALLEGREDWELDLVALGAGDRV